MKAIYLLLATGILAGCASTSSYPYSSTPYYSAEYFAEQEKKIKERACRQVADTYRFAKQMRDQGISESDAKVLMMRHESVTTAKLAAGAYTTVSTVYAGREDATPEQYYQVTYDLCMEHDSTR